MGEGEGEEKGEGEEGRGREREGIGIGRAGERVGAREGVRLCVVTFTHARARAHTHRCGRQYICK